MAERPARRRKSAKSVEQLKAEISVRDTARKEAKAKKDPTGAAANPGKYGFKKKLTPGEQHELEKKKRADAGGSGTYSYSQHLMRGSGSTSNYNPKLRTFEEFVEIANELNG